MFKCEKCGVSSRPGEKLNKTVTKTRPHRHPERHYRAKGKEMVDLGNQFATQIEREQTLCTLCAALDSGEPLVQQLAQVMGQVMGAASFAQHEMAQA